MNKFESKGVSYDNRFIFNFTKSEQMLHTEKTAEFFQPVLQSGHGGCVKDADWNNYIDVTLGGGDVTFGHGYTFDQSKYGALTLSPHSMTTRFATATEILCTTTLEAATGMKCLGYAQSVVCARSIINEIFPGAVVFELFSDDTEIVQGALTSSITTQESGKHFVVNEAVGSGRFAYPSIAHRRNIPVSGIIFGPGLANGYPFYPVCVCSKYIPAITASVQESFAPFLMKHSAVLELTFATAIRAMEYFENQCVAFNLQRYYKALRSGLKSGINSHNMEDKICLDEQCGRIFVKLRHPSSLSNEKIFRGKMASSLIGRGVYVEMNELAFSPCFATTIEHVVRVTLAFKAALGDYINSLD